MSVGLFADLRDIVLSVDLHSATVAGVVVQLLHKLRHKDWEIHNFARAAETTWVNTHPKDKSRYGAGRFLPLTESEFQGAGGFANAVDGDDEDHAEDGGSSIVGGSVGGGGDISASSDAGASSVAGRTPAAASEPRAPKGRTNWSAGEKLKFVLVEESAEEYIVKLIVSDRYMRGLRGLGLCRNEWVRRFWISLNKAIGALISDPCMRVHRPLGSHELSICRPWENPSDPANNTFKKFLAAGGRLSAETGRALQAERDSSDKFPHRREIVVGQPVDGEFLPDHDIMCFASASSGATWGSAFESLATGRNGVRRRVVGGGNAIANAGHDEHSSRDMDISATLLEDIPSCWDNDDAGDGGFVSSPRSAARSTDGHEHEQATSTDPFLASTQQGAFYSADGAATRAPVQSTSSPIDTRPSPEVFQSFRDAFVVGATPQNRAKIERLEMERTHFHAEVRDSAQRGQEVIPTDIEPGKKLYTKGLPSEIFGTYRFLSVRVPSNPSSWPESIRNFYRDWEFRLLYAPSGSSSPSTPEKFVFGLPKPISVRGAKSGRFSVFSPKNYKKGDTCKLVYFAVRGTGLVPMSIRKVLESFYPEKEVIADLVARRKLNRRTQHFFSDSIAGGVIPADVIRDGKRDPRAADLFDGPSPEEWVIVSDGCSEISASLAQKIFPASTLPHGLAFVSFRLGCINTKGGVAVAREDDPRRGDWLNLAPSQQKCSVRNFVSLSDAQRRLRICKVAKEDLSPDYDLNWEVAMVMSNLARKYGAQSRKALLDFFVESRCGNGG